MLNLWSQVLQTFNPPSATQVQNASSFQDAIKRYDTISFDSIDYVPASLPVQDPNCRLVMVEDNDAVIKMLQKGRAPNMAHVARTHRVNLDWLLERSINDPCLYCRYIDTKAQIADMLTKPNFTVKDWCHLCGLFRLGPPTPAKGPDAKFAAVVNTTLHEELRSVLADLSLSQDDLVQKIHSLFYHPGGGH